MAFDFDAFCERMTPQIHRALGPETVLLLRASPLESVKGQNNPKALVLAADAAMGATSISLQLVDGSLLKGALLAASRLRLAGVEYSVQVDAAVAAPSGSTLTGVSVLQVDADPPLGLAAAAVAGAEVDLLSGPTFVFVDCFVMKAGRRDEGADLSAELFFTVSLPTLGAPTTPKVGDSIRRLKDGSAGAIAQLPVMIGGAWDCAIGPP